MKHEDEIKVSRAVYRQIQLLINSKKFKEFQKKEKANITKFSMDKKIPSLYLAQLRRNIKSFLRSEQIPQSWSTPIYNNIVYDKLDLPLESGITLLAGDQEFTSERDEIIILKNHETGEIDPDNISLRISSKVSLEFLIRFIKKNRATIESLMEQLELPDHNSNTLPRLDLALRIIELKDTHKLTFSDIADTLSSDSTLNDTERQYTSDENNIKTLYYRYKKILK